MAKRLGKIALVVSLIGIAISSHAQTNSDSGTVYIMSSNTQYFKRDSTKTNDENKNVKIIPDANPPAPIDESIAFEWAIGGSVIPIASGLFIAYNTKSPPLFFLGATLISVGGIIGPSMGEFYAESYVQGMLGILERVLGAVIFNAGEMAGSCISSDNGCSYNEGGDPYMAIGIGIIVASTIYDLTDLPDAVDRHNAKIHSAYNFRVVPEISYQPNRQPMIGEKAILSF